MTPGCLLCLLGACLLSHRASSRDLVCGKQQYEHNGKCCERCAPGQKLVADCSASAHPHCEPCEAGNFQPHWTQEKHCIQHKTCDANTGLVTRVPGDDKRDAECECQDGMYCSGPNCQTCLQITACSPGKGVAQKATSSSDTVCVACAHGTFSNTSSTSEPCHPWTSCEALGLVKTTTGTNILDVVCEPSRSRFSVLLLVPITALIAACFLVVLLYRLYPRGVLWCAQKQDTVLPEAVDMPMDQLQGSAKVDYEEHDERQDFPVQETLLCRQPVAQEDGKESRISEQERL
uniref:Tumor necrosis factor receptor superfamily member 5 n=1 Tax=Pelusios castaneus TaxID=367368 RepID=A0A8C8S357_9SAUR